jgi:ABC-2 type transport system ATP-binding protein
LLAIDVAGLVKTYPARRLLREVISHPLNRLQVSVLNGIDLKVAPAEVVGILGQNGAGKTTLLKILATIVRPSAGSARICGFDTETQADLARAKVSYTFTDERSFYWRLSGRQNLEFFAALDELPANCAHERIGELSERLNFSAYIERPFSQYSAGMRQRFFLARALLRQPSVLLLDEPSRSLDPQDTARLWSFIRDDLVKEQGMSVLLVTHQLEEAAAICDRVAILCDGRLQGHVRSTMLKQAASKLDRLRFMFDEPHNGDVAQLRQVQGVRELTFSEQGGPREFDVWCDNGELALPEIIAAANAVGARLRSFNRPLAPSEALTQLMETGDD